MGVSRETSERLDIFAKMLASWTQKINLIAPSTVSEIHSRHIADSTQIYPLAPKDWRTWVDLGSGGGLPGLVIAILAMEKTRARRVVLVESDARKCAFLRAVLRETGTEAEVLNKRIEAVAPQSADVVSARALATLNDLLGYTQRHLSDHGTALFPKGRKADQELQQALEGWTFACEKHPSATDPEGVILEIGDIARV